MTRPATEPTFDQPNPPPMNPGLFGQQLTLMEELKAATFPAHAQPDDGSAAPLDANAAFRKRLLYRSKQRGWCVRGKKRTFGGRVGRGGDVAEARGGREAPRRFSTPRRLDRKSVV